MRVRFLFDYEGRETSYRKVKEGDVIELPHQAAIELVNLYICEEVGDANEYEKPKRKKEKVIYEPDES